MSDIYELTENPLLFQPLPETKKELEELEAIIARKMSEANFRSSQATQKMILFSQKGNAFAMAEQVAIKSEASMELRLLSERWMAIVKKQNDLLEITKATK